MNSVKFTEHQWPEGNVTSVKKSRNLIVLLQAIIVCTIVCCSFYFCSTVSSMEGEKTKVVEAINATNQNAMDILSGCPTLSQLNLLLIYSYQNSLWESNPNGPSLFKNNEAQLFSHQYTMANAGVPLTHIYSINDFKTNSKS